MILTEGNEVPQASEEMAAILLSEDSELLNKDNLRKRFNENKAKRDKLVKSKKGEVFIRAVNRPDRKLETKSKIPKHNSPGATEEPTEPVV